MRKTVVDLLATNLKTLMGKTPELSTQKAVGERAHVDQKTISRMLSASNAATISNVEQVAKAFRLEAWQMLHPTIGRGEGLGFSPEAAEVARHLDSLRDDPDPDKLKWALQMTNMLFTDRPKTPEETGALVAMLLSTSVQTPATPGRSPGS
jgi:hypothetical protein